MDVLRGFLPISKQAAIVAGQRKVSPYVQPVIAVTEERVLKNPWVAGVTVNAAANFTLKTAPGQGRHLILVWLAWAQRNATNATCLVQEGTGGVTRFTAVGTTAANFFSFRFEPEIEFSSNTLININSDGAAGHDFRFTGGGFDVHD